MYSQTIVVPLLLTALVVCGLSACSKSEQLDVSPSSATTAAESVSASGASLSVSSLPEIDLNQRVAVTNQKITNLEAPIPPQCYTKTENINNPCYTCHQMYDRKADLRMNRLDDGGLQGVYLFSEEGSTNHWKNLFEDRSDWLAQISDQAIRAYIDQDNYAALAPKLQRQGWKGFVPDLNNYAAGAAAFDAQGVALDGSGWVAFNYKPFPGTFWPTNGSTDDVIIRLPKHFREVAGAFDRAAYLINLSLVELTITDHASISIPATDERALNRDLDGNGKLTATATRLVKQSHYVGDAQDEPVVFQQYPQNAELMHSVRYVGVDEANNIVVPKRMKELRYMRKIRVLEQYDLDSRYARERKEKNMGQLPDFVDLGEQGMENGMGWVLQSYIEDYDGELRPQSYEENLFCMGCHAAVGSTIDQTFALARKVSGAEGWGYINIKGMVDAPNIGETRGEILNYLARAGGGSEFRENPEMLARWFQQNGMVDEEKVSAADVYELITPSAERALQLNKAYTHIVRNQSYIYGRDATWVPVNNVFKSVDETTPILHNEHRYYGWDIRLDWSNAE